MWTLILKILLQFIFFELTDAGNCTVYYSRSESCTISSPYKSKCGLFGWSRCTRYRTVYSTCYKSYSRRTCCPGYSGMSCSTPMCFGLESCLNGGSCYSPGVCSCPTGFSPPRCTDIDECGTSTHDCKHNCVNTDGSYYCTCRTGYTLNPDLRSCTDIDECADGISSCSDGCTNYEGSYQCICPSGYALSENGFICEDLNECLELNGGCQDNCTNTEGSFECSCFDDRILQGNGFSCKGDADHGVTVFEKWSISSQLLAKPCFEVLLTRCIDDRNIEVKLASTSEWYTLEADENIFYTSGITYVKINSFSLPVSLKGIKVTVVNNSFEYSHNVNFEGSDGTLKISDLTCPDRKAYVFNKSDIFDFISANSFSKTFLWSLFPQLPNWLQFETSNHSAIVVQDMKSDLVYGHNMDALTECSGAPVIDSHLYSVFRFDSGFSLQIYGTQINLPSLLNASKFCIIADLCQEFGGTTFLMIPEESRDLLLELPLFQFLKNELNLQIKPRGIGLSLVNGIHVDYQQAMQVWNGDHMFLYSVIRTADIWIGGEVEKHDKHFSIKGSADMYFQTPKLETMFTSLFRDEWNGLVEVRVSAAPILRFRLFKKNYAVKFTIATTDVDAYVSIGGKNRTQCGENSNPAGIFFSAFININPFVDVPILKNWFKNNIRVYSFVSKSSQEIPSSIDHFSDAIFQISHILNDTIDVIEGSLNELKVIVSNVALTLLQTVTASFSAMQEIVDRYLPQAWITGDMNNIILSAEMLRQSFSDAKQTVTQFIGAVEFILNETIESMVSMLRMVIDQLQILISNTLNSITESTVMEAGNYTNFGLKCVTDISIFGLQFPLIDLEIIHSDGNLFKCTKFDRVIKFLNGEKAIRFLGRFPLPIKLGNFLKLETGGIGGALASNSNKVVLHFQAVATMLGLRATGDVFITSGGGLFFYIEGNIWDIFFAKINVSAEVGKQWYELAFVLEGRFVTNSRNKRQSQTCDGIFQDSYLDALIKVLGMIADNAQIRLRGVVDSLTKSQTDLTKAQNWLEDKKTDVRNANSAFDKAVSALETAKDELEIAKVSLKEAIARLEAAQKKVDNLCRISTCSKNCIPGIKCKICHKNIWGIQIPYPCCRFTSCMIRLPNPLCVLANIACKIIRGIAYHALEVAKIFVRTALLAFDIAQTAVSVAQVSVDKSRVVLRIAEEILDLAQSYLECAKSVLEAAKQALEVVKRSIGTSAMVLQLVIENGSKNLLDVRNCGFKVELSTNDLPVFDVSCEVNAFRLGWAKVQLTINFKNILQSIWHAAQATISALMKTLGNVLGRKRRSLEFVASSKVHRLLRILRHADDFGELSLNETIDITENANDFDMTENTDAADRIRYYYLKCHTIQRLQDFLQNAFGALQETVNDSKSYVNNVTKVKDKLFEYSNTGNIVDNFTAEDAGINKEYAAKDFNMTDVDIDITLKESKLAAPDDPLLMEIKNAANTFLHNIELETKSVESIDFINIWYTAMDNVTKKYFNNTECNGFRDCMFYTISSLYELYEAEEFPNMSMVKESILELERVVIDSFQNETTSIIDTSVAMDYIVNEINRLSGMNPFCSEAPTIRVHPKNVTVLLGTAATFNCIAISDPEPSYWWYKDDFLLRDELTKTLTLKNISESDNGTRITCVAGNIVANVTSLDAYLLTADFDIDECAEYNGNCEYRCLNTIGSYYCACPDGYSINETNGLNCTDTDECDGHFKEGMCEQICNNYIGGNNCSCYEGYIINIDGFSCDDINECAVENGGCDYQCVNLDGSFQCICNEGYVGSGSVGQCVDENECETDNGGCEQTCTNTDGSFMCECLVGYEIDMDKTHCREIDECLEDNGGCEHRCVNTEGTYSCSCSLGFNLEEDLLQCSDIDECKSNNSGCVQQCNNTQGSFFCDCSEGYQLNSNGFDCTDIDECNVENGNCGQKCLNQLGSFICECNTGYGLAEDGYECFDIDECDEDHSICEHACVNTDGSFLCACDDGFVLDVNGFGCIDINECSTFNSRCAHNCTNKEGSYICECTIGYTLNADGYNCSDIDECLQGNGGCEHECVNTEGAYGCNCSSGYVLEDDQRQCSDINECTTNNGGCEHKCTNLEGSFLCSCDDGFKLGSNELECLDVDECITNNGGCDHVCTNNDGTFTCSCRFGYVLDDNGMGCLDFDECSLNNGGCEYVCTNNEGSFDCSCRSGYVLTGDSKCVDNDECTTGGHNCEQECKNTVGSFTCMCGDGYELDVEGFRCNDVDECLADNGGCHQLCTNTDGSFACDCAGGFVLDSDGFKCHDVNECSDRNGECEQLCLNENGSFQCACNEGYLLKPDRKLCADINECADDNGGCSHICENTAGSYQCLCKLGFSLNAGNQVCEDVDECLMHNGGCQHECANTMGSFQCSCQQNFVLDRFGFACLGRTERSFQASITLDFVFKQKKKAKLSKPLTSEAVQQSLEAFYNTFTSSSGVTVVIHSMRTTSSKTEINYTVIYDENDSTNLVHATLVLSNGTDIDFDGVSIASRSYLPANITDECHVLEAYIEGCEQGQRCEISKNGPQCLDEVKKITTSIYVVFTLPVFCVVVLCIAIKFRRLCIKD